MPTSSDVAALERALPGALARAIRFRAFSNDSTLVPENYFRQYVGIVVGGKRLIYINGFHRGYLVLSAQKDDTTRWRREPVEVCDGGDWFFGAEYDPATGTVRNLRFNANA